MDDADCTDRTDDGSAAAGAGDDGADADLAWETLGGDRDYACPGFDVRRDDVRLPDGTETEYHYVDESSAVVILPFTPDGDVVVVDEWRQAVGRVNRGLPAGSVEDDDADLAAAARRELREETGHEADAVERLTTVEPSNGIANSVHHHFLARGCTPTADTDFDADESIRPTTVGYGALRAAALGGDLRDGRATLAVALYEARGADADPGADGDARSRPDGGPRS